jgi:hypothetical protein
VQLAAVGRTKAAGRADGGSQVRDQIVDASSLGGDYHFTSAARRGSGGRRRHRWRVAVVSAAARCRTLGGHGDDEADGGRKIDIVGYHVRALADRRSGSAPRLQQTP